MVKYGEIRNTHHEAGALYSTKSNKLLYPCPLILSLKCRAGAVGSGVTPSIARGHSAVFVRIAAVALQQGLVLNKKVEPNVHRAEHTHVPQRMRGKHLRRQKTEVKKKRHKES